MNKIAKIALHEYATNVKRPGFLFFTFLVPIMGLIALLVAALFSGQATRFVTSQFTRSRVMTGIIDESHLFTPISSAYANRFTAFPDEVSARGALASKQIDSFIVIPADYVQSGRITVYAPSGLEATTSVGSDRFRALLVEGLLVGKVDPQLVKRASEPVNLTLITIDSSGKPSTASPFSLVSGVLAPYFLSLLLVISIFVSSSYLLRSVSEEKETRVIEILLSSVSATELLGGKVIGLGALGLTQVIVWLVSAFMLNGGVVAAVAGSAIALNPVTFLLAAVYFVLGYLVFSIIMAAAGSLGTNMRESQQLAGIFSFSAAVPYMIGGLLIANPNALIARVLSFFPLTAATMMMLRLPLGTVPAEDVIVSILVLLVTIPIFLWAGAKIFRMGLLMYGKRPSVKEIVRALRSA